MADGGIITHLFPIYIYFGDNLFSKLLNFECKEHKYLLKYAKSKVFNSIISSPEAKIDDVYLGWSFLIYKIGSKYYHAGFFNSKEGKIEVFKDYNKELNIRCGVNEIFAFSRDGDLLHYSSKSVCDVISISCSKQQNVRDIKSTDSYSVVLFYDGTICLLKLQENESLIPLEIQSPIIEVACGKEHALFLTASGQVLSFGSGSRGQLGHGTIENQDKPTLLEALDGIKIKLISCGGWHSTAISDAGDLYIWGWNESGQLGFPCAEVHGNVLPLSEIEAVCCLPKLVDFEKEVQISSVSCGTRHTVVLTEDNEVWSWGWNEYGQLGHGEYPICDKPCKVSLPDKFIPKSVVCAFWSTLISGSLSV